MKHKKRSFLSLLLALLLCMGSMISMFSISTAAATVSADTEWEGTGEKETPYLISNANELAGLATQVNSGNTYKGVYFKLTADIVYNDGNAADWATSAPDNKWTPIGNASTKYFSGNFDGDSHTISGLYCVQSSARVALFGDVRNATVKNVTLTNSYFSSTGTSGGIIGYASSKEADTSLSVTVENCHCDAIIKSTGTGIGGIVGQADCTALTVTDCSFSGSVSATRLVAGIVGNCTPNATVTGCVNYGNVSATDNTADKTAYPYQASGIMGYAANGATLTNCVSIGEVKSYGGAYDTASGTITMTNASGEEVTSYGPGALVGRIGKAITVNNCFVQKGHYALGQSNTQPDITEFNSVWELPSTTVSLYNKLNFLGYTSLVSTFDGASIRLGNPTGMRFIAEVDLAAYEALVTAGAAVDYGTVIAPAGNSSPIELHKAGVKDTYLDIKATAGSWFVNAEDPDGTYIAGTISNIKTANYEKDFTAVAYCTVTFENESVTIYSQTTCTRNVSAVAQAALNDSGSYTPEQQKILSVFCGAATQA